MKSYRLSSRASSISLNHHWACLADRQVSQLLVRDRNKLTADRIPLDDDVAALVANRIMHAIPGIAALKLMNLAMPASDQELDRGQTGKPARGPPGAVLKSAVGRSEVAAHLTDDPVGRMARGNRAELCGVMDGHIGPVVLNDRLRLQHHLLMERFGQKLAALQFVMSET